MVVAAPDSSQNDISGDSSVVASRCTWPDLRLDDGLTNGKGGLLKVDLASGHTTAAHFKVTLAEG